MKTLSASALKALWAVAAGSLLLGASTGSGGGVTDSKTGTSGNLTEGEYGFDK
jgi:hypothetical protein